MPVVIMAVVMVSMVMIMCVTVVVIMRVAMREGVAVMMVIRMSHALARFAGEAPLNTDDHPVVSYRAPRITYLPDSLPRDRLITLLRAVDIHPDELIGNDDTSLRDTDWTARLEAYWTARNRYLEMGSAVQPTTDVRRMLATVREPLLSVLRVSPDFRPAYDPLLRMAIALGRIDPPAARALLLELQQVQPLRPEATRALRDLLGETS